MIREAVCTECQAPLPGDAPGGLCPRCLLQYGVLADSRTPVSGVATSTGAYGGAFVPPTPAELAERFPHLEILELLGQGGMGAVYKARQTKLDRLVALKILPPEWGKDAAFAERFAREARALAKLSHPQVVGVHDFGESGGLFYFLMEYVDGANLRQVLLSGRLQAEETLRIVGQVCDALQYAHEEGIVHRDIKPENILLDRKGRVKIADFGLAKLVSPTPAIYTLTGSRQIMGTPHYMAPEQMEKPHTVDHRADIYSLGVVLYEMLTGGLPLGRFAPPSRKGNCDVRLDEVVLRALEKEPEERYQWVSELRQELDAVSRSGPDPVTATAPSIAVPPVVLPLSLPCATERLGGVTPCLLRFDGTALTLEHRVGWLKRATYRGPDPGMDPRVEQTVIPLATVQSLELHRGWLQTRLVLQTGSMTTLAKVPAADKGRVELRLSRLDWEMAHRFAAGLARHLPAGTHIRIPAVGVPSRGQEQRLRNRIALTSVALILVGIVNPLCTHFVMGWARIGSNEWDLLGVMLGLNAALGVGLLAGVVRLRRHMHGSATRAAWASLLLPTVGWPITAPFCALALLLLRRADHGENEDPKDPRTDSSTSLSPLPVSAAVPAFGLIFLGGITFLCGVTALPMILYDWNREFLVKFPECLLVYVGFLALLAITGFLILGGSRMLQGRFDRVALGAAVWAVLPWPYGFLITYPLGWMHLTEQSKSLAIILPPIIWGLGIVIGTWAILALRRVEVRATFPRETRMEQPPAPTGAVRRKARSIAQALKFWMIGSEVGDASQKRPDGDETDASAKRR